MFKQFSIFLVIIDDKLNWEPQIENLRKKLNSSMVMIKRIAKFVPKSEYMKIYNALFKSDAITDATGM